MSFMVLGHKQQQRQQQWGNRISIVLQRRRGNGDGATETPAIDESIAMAPGQGHRGTGALGHRSRGNRTTVIAMAMGQRSIDRLIVFYIAAQNVDNSGC
jgi:hypothetical protein